MKRHYVDCMIMPSPLSAWAESQSMIAAAARNMPHILNPLILNGLSLFVFATGDLVFTTLKHPDPDPLSFFFLLLQGLLVYSRLLGCLRLKGSPPPGTTLCLCIRFLL